MAYGKLVEGNRVFTATTDVNAAAADINEVEDQIRGWADEQEIDIFSLFMPISQTGSEDWWFGYTSDYWFWYNQNGPSVASVKMVAVVPVRAGQKITDLSITIGGHSTATGGSIKLRRRLKEATYKAATPNNYADVDTFGSNPWQLIGTGYETLTISPDHIVAPGYTYIVECIACSVALMVSVLGCTVTAQLGN